MGEKIIYYKENYFNKRNQDDIISTEGDKDKNKKNAESINKKNNIKKEIRDKEDLKF